MGKRQGFSGKISGAKNGKKRKRNQIDVYKRQVLNVMKQLATTGLTMIIVTHEMAFARDVSTSTIFMDAGYVAEDAPPSQLFSNPKKPRTREFLSRYLAG